ncbi:MAG: TldD/PmbA family protein [Elusimicrobiota bacterium]
MRLALDAGSLRFSDWAPALTGGDHAEAFLEESRGSSISFEDSRVTEMSSGADCGAGLRYLFKTKDPKAFETLHGSLTGLDPDGARALADRLLSGTPRTRPPQGGAPSVHRQSLYRRPGDVPVEETIALLKGIDRTIRSEFPYISQVRLDYAEREKRFAVLDSKGSFRAAERVSVIFIVSVTAGKDGVLQNGHEVIGGLKGYELLTDFNPLRAGRAAARAAVEKLSAPIADAGEMPVVLASSAGGTFIHEAIGHSLEADHVQEGTSPHYAGKVGQQVANEFLTIIDDPTLPFARGSYPFDDEGCPARPTPVVTNGVLTEYLYDRLSAMRDGREPNGHGRRESFRHRPLPRMSNLYIAPGPDDPHKIIRELGRGLLVTKMGGGEVNTATGEFVFGVEDGYRVEKGQILHRVRDANMLGVGPDVLRSIDRLGWDIGWGIGTCGKQGQGVPVADGQPTLRIPRLLIGGRKQR